MVVNEAEAEAEEEAEQEAEQEEQKMSAFGRDDEQANPWALEEVQQVERIATGGEAGGPARSGVSAQERLDHPFYPLSAFRVAPAQPTLSFPAPLLVSDNFFRPRWVGLGERRLKNVVFLLELFTQPTRGRKHAGQDGGSSQQLAHKLAGLHRALLAEGRDPNAAAAAALAMLLADPAAAFEASSPAADFGGGPAGEGEPLNDPLRYLAVLSLAEGETLRRALHAKSEAPPSSWSSNRIL
jgi:hypothetical protein